MNKCVTENLLTLFEWTESISPVLPTSDMPGANVSPSLSRNLRCVFGSKRKYQMLLLELVCSIENIFIEKKKKQKVDFERQN